MCSESAVIECVPMFKVGCGSVDKLVIVLRRLGYQKVLNSGIAELEFFINFFASDLHRQTEPFLICDHGRGALQLSWHSFLFFSFFSSFFWLTI